MTIVGKKKNAPVMPSEQIKDVVRIESDQKTGETFCLVKKGEHTASWVKVQKVTQGIRISQSSTVVVCHAKQIGP